MKGIATGFIKVIFLPFNLVFWFLGLFKKPISFIKQTLDDEKKYVSMRKKFYNNKRKQYKMNDELI